MDWIKIILEILFLYFAFYALIRSFQGTLGERIIKGYIGLFIIISAGLLFITHYFALYHLKYILSRLMSVYFFIALVVIFQRELRIGVLHLGETLFGKISEDTPPTEQELLAALSFLARRKTGALIAIERSSSLKQYLTQGIETDALLSKELLWAIFWHESLLHDGGIIIQNGRIAAASCIFPLTEKNLPGYLGTRHRAAVGLSEITDAIVLVVSEERGEISLCHEGKLYLNLTVDETEVKIKNIEANDNYYVPVDEEQIEPEVEKSETQIQKQEAS